MSADRDEIQSGLDEACRLVGDECADGIIKDVSAIVAETLNAAFDREDSKGFYEQVLKPYVTSYVYLRVAVELTKRHNQQKALFDVAWNRRYPG